MKPVDPSPFLSRELLGTVSQISSPSSLSKPAGESDVLDDSVVVVVVGGTDFDVDVDFDVVVVSVVVVAGFDVDFDSVSFVLTASVCVSIESNITVLCVNASLSVFKSSFSITFLILSMIALIISSLTSLRLGRECPVDRLKV